MYLALTGVCVYGVCSVCVWCVVWCVLDGVSLIILYLSTIHPGYRLKARENTFAGIATHFIPRAQVIDTLATPPPVTHVSPTASLTGC